jgi:hypothetical protein
MGYGGLVPGALFPELTALPQDPTAQEQAVQECPGDSKHFKVETPPRFTAKYSHYDNLLFLIFFAYKPGNMRKGVCYLFLETGQISSNTTPQPEP